jgi:hypothetical protein
MKKVFGVKHSSLFAPKCSFDEKTKTLAYFLQSVVLTKKKFLVSNTLAYLLQKCSFNEKKFYVLGPN